VKLIELIWRGGVRRAGANQNKRKDGKRGKKGKFPAEGRIDVSASFSQSEKNGDEEIKTIDGSKGEAFY
jgi:hypothetical protein